MFSFKCFTFDNLGYNQSSMHYFNPQVIFGSDNSSLLLRTFSFFSKFISGFYDRSILAFAF